MAPFRFGCAFTVAVAALAGCSSTPVAPPAAATAGTSTTASAPTPTAPAAQPLRPAGSSSTVATVSLPAHLDPKNPLSIERSVYFDFDVFTIKSEYAGLIERHGRYLASQSNLAIKVEGNADERGSAEYNLALGQKRAQAVLQALKLQGAKDGQMEAISWGKERPKATGHDEAAWAENRRADLVYPKR